MKRRWSMEVGKFSAWPAITEAWELLKGSRRTYVYMTLTAAVVTWLAGTLLGAVLPPAAPEMVTLANGEVVPLVRESTAMTLGTGLSFGTGAATAYPWAERIVGAAISALFAGAFAAFALRRAVGLPVRYAMIAEYFRYFPVFLLLELLAFGLLYLLGQFGSIAVTVATLVGSVVFTFVQFFVVDRDAGVPEAIQGSLGVVGANLGQTVLLLVAGAVAGLALTVPVGLATLVMPFTVSIILGIATGIASILLAGLIAVALACAFRDAVGVRNAGGEMPIEDGYGGTALSSRA